MRISTPPPFPAVLFLLTFINAFISAQVTLQYRHQTGDKWHITSRINEEVLFDGKIYRRVEILNKISVEVLKSNGNDGLLHNHYQIAERQVG